MKILILYFSKDFINHESIIEFLFHLTRKNAVNVYDAGIFYQKNNTPRKDQNELIHTKKALKMLLSII